MEMTPALESFSFLFCHLLSASPFPPAVALSLTISLSLLHPCQRTRAPCLTRHTCFLSTQRALTFEARGFASEATRIEAMMGECSTRGEERGREKR